jgi:hypothetical protein
MEPGGSMPNTKLPVNLDISSIAKLFHRFEDYCTSAVKPYAMMDFSMFHNS